MTIIEILSLNNGAHRNQSGVTTIPDGWAVIPDDMETPNFPFGSITTAQVNGVMTVTSWTALPIPEPVPSSESVPHPSQLDRIEAQVLYTALMSDTLIEGE